MPGVDRVFVGTDDALGTNTAWHSQFGLFLHIICSIFILGGGITSVFFCMSVELKFCFVRVYVYFVCSHKTRAGNFISRCQRLLVRGHVFLTVRRRALSSCFGRG